MNINIICVGKIKESYLREGIAEYAKRLSKYCTLNIIELSDEKCPEVLSDAEMVNVKDKEGNRILEKINDSDYVIAMAIEGKQRDSVEMSRHLEELMIDGHSTIDFIIGGSLGLSEKVMARANEKFSFSKLTFPHQLMRMILLEQIYRSFRIMKNEPYHK